MSFARSARKALDASLPLDQRFTGLKGCIERYHPIGFAATMSFLEAVAGDFAKDPAALPLAVELLTASRNAWQAEVRAYAVLRRRAKRLGYRVPHPAAPNPSKPSHWYGARREAALHAVWFWYSKGDVADVDLHCLASALVRRGRLTGVQLAMFDEVHTGLRQRLAAVDGPGDLGRYHEVRQLLVLAGHIAVVTGRS
ncbi:hypothetical protein BBK82_09985 [Lentzea guizhouensis]|uniref:Uncharacterized protein n=1 Tax=Lentzea guizhouensis TaxID=1586287 RepID=A0A1B2HF72_9PSEU|nr:hypothetical protein [Lentzea guizhouensis]ANZ36345.1 hypothetical protein BBK82_09985 [Lentzea guizhouensis]